ncbi:FadR/GntR family transcriptional regulator [Pusillimonas sp. ANT_WB101]|uniref:FadR/GntR family transcriptional regulator n=1 Tax=Pusillimonas sp. ANT_WB101 TaxID=2597356 RepID=UPI0011F03867|nr:FadR/GntR family transcriptional regulator [Pusillimonas sp. ANT_WB101]KAA0910521.1 FadR family transcriptional regulator [Pusillimonas sp. ANT_WB101]
MGDMHGPGIEKVQKSGTLADQVTDVLLHEIQENKFPVHSRLPSEAELTKRFGVSRTVIREAVSRLKSEGLVGSRRGSGTRVLEANIAKPFRLDVNLQDSVLAVLRVIELRRGVEAEMAALAAERRTSAQNSRIKKAFDNIRKAEIEGRDGVDEDVAFHTAISQASGNPLYTSLLSFLSQYLRTAMHVTRTNEAQRQDFSRQVHSEHAAIMKAISRKDPAAARAAALHHMENAAIRIKAADATFWTPDMGKVAQRLIIPGDTR